METFAGKLVARHQAQGRGEIAGAAGELGEHADRAEVEAARINLADGIERRGKPRCLRTGLLERARLAGIAVEQGDLVEPRADRALQAARRISVQHVDQALVRQQHLFAEHRDALAERGDLRGDVVRARREQDVAQLPGALRETQEGGDALGLDEPERAEDLQLLDVFGEVAAGHALVEVLVTGEFAELLDARLHVVAGDAFPPHDGVQVDLVLDPLVALDHAVRHRNAEIALALHHRDPVFAFEADLAFAAPDGAHGGRGVAFGEDVGDVILGHGH